MVRNCAVCEAAYNADQLDNKHCCPTCRKDNRLMLVLMAVVVPLLASWGWMMLKIYGR